MNLLVFFDFEPKNCFRVPTPWGLYGVEWDEHVVHFAAVYALFSHFVLCWWFWRTSVTPCYPL